MLTLLDIFIFLFILCIVATVYWYATIPRNLPPGPVGLPLIGSSYEYRNGSDQHLIALEQVKKYGPLFKFYIANKLIVVLGDYDTIQEALVKQGDIFAGRPQLHSLLPEKTLHHGLILSEGDLWKEQRRFSLSTLRDFGIGRPIIEPRIREEIDYLSERINEYARTGSAMDPQPVLMCAVSNVISQLIFGRRFSYDDEEFVQQFTALSRRITAAGVGFFSPFMFSDWFAAFAKHLPLVKRLQVEVDSYMDFVEREVDKTVKVFDPDSDPSNYIHAYMKAGNDHQSGTFTDIQLLASVVDLFVAGTETTSTSLRYALLLLAAHPDIQEKMYKEIKDQVGTSSLPNYADRTQLPYAEAVVMETQRFANLTPFGVSRRSLQATKLMGYDIPEDAIVVPFLTNVLHNPDLFPNPEKFDPTRFLDSAGKVYRDPKLIPFQAGKRICLGEPLARIELFLLLVALISRFRFYFSKDQKPDLKPVVGILSAPVSYRVHVEARSD